MTGERRLIVVRTIERVAGRYEVGETEFGRVYRWSPGHVFPSVAAARRSVFTGSTTTCGCGVDHAAIVREEPVGWETKLFALAPCRGLRRRRPTLLKGLWLRGLRHRPPGHSGPGFSIVV